MAQQSKRKKWSDVKARLETVDRKGLVSLLGDLYDASEAKDPSGNNCTILDGP